MTDATAKLPFSAYTGDGPFIFVSYSHRDTEVVYPFLKWLHDAGINIWYDEGISLGQSWPQELAEAIQRAGEFVLIVTPHAGESPNCQREVNFALSRDKAFLAIHLDDVELPAGVELSISDRQAIMRTRLSEDEFQSKLLDHLAPYRGRARPAPTQEPPKGTRLSWVAGLLVGVLLIGVVAWWVTGSLNEQDEIIDHAGEARALIDAGDTFTAWRLLEAIEARSTELQELYESVTLPSAIRSDPPGAKVEFKRYGPDDDWMELGVTPIETRLPIGFFQVRLSAPGHVTRSLAANNPGYRFNNMLGQGADANARPINPGMDSYGTSMLPPLAGAPDGAVYVQAGDFNFNGTVTLPAFWIDEFETTNAEFKEFIDAGGYTDEALWEGLEFLKEGQRIPREEAIALMVDQTGRPGPAGWSLGNYPDGRASHPVGGVSWYEAVAYARFRGRQLPTLTHWNRAAFSTYELGRPAIPYVVRYGHYDSEDTMPVGGLLPGPVGASGMAGNVREWLANPVDDHGGRAIRGGGYTQANYMYRLWDGAPALDRSLINGIRLALYEPNPRLAGNVVDSVRDFSKLEPLNDSAFGLLADELIYESTPFTATEVSVDESNRRWVTEKVELPTPAGDVMDMLILKPHGPGPFQAVIYFPGAGAFAEREVSGADAGNDPRFVVSTGRALVRPAWSGFYNRTYSENLMEMSLSERREASRSRTIRARRELGRVIDYLELRPDIDATRIAAMGFSFGGSALFPSYALEPRIDAVILISAGLSRGPTGHPIGDAFHFLPRVVKPVLMLNGKHDIAFQLDSQQRYMFEMLGTPEADKRHVVYEDVGHLPIPPVEMMRETADWLDRYLGPAGN